MTPQDRLVKELRHHADPASVVDAAKVARPWSGPRERWNNTKGLRRYALGGQEIGIIHEPARPGEKTPFRALVLGEWVEGCAENETEARRRVDGLLGLDGWLLQGPAVAEGLVEAQRVEEVAEDEPGVMYEPLPETAVQR
jgi:hypothetical protein